MCTMPALVQALQKKWNWQADRTYPCLRVHDKFSDRGLDSGPIIYFLIESYQSLGYIFINYTPSIYKSAKLDRFSSLSLLNAHKVLGQEFDKVILLMGESFYYEDDCLHAYQHPNPNYLYHKMLFQAMTRVRDKLCIVVMNNPDAFSKLINIKEKHCE